MSPTEPADDTGKDAAAVLRLATLLVGGSGLVGLIARFVGGARVDAGTFIGGTLLLVCAITFALVHARRVTIASWLFLSTAWLCVGAISINRGGLYSGTVGLYLLCTVMAGVLVSARAAIVSCALSVPASLGLLVAEAQGLMPPGAGMTLQYRGLTAVLTLVVTTAIFLVALRRLQRANQELREAHASLGKTVEERTQSLVVARDQALAAARAKMAFLANMSHELRTPMNAVVGIAELLRVKGLDPDTRELVETIGKSGDALVTILDDVLDLAKIEAGRLIVEEAVYEPRVAVDELLGLLSAQARSKGVTLSTRFTEEVPRHVLGDRTRVRQVLMNLAGNALKFTDAGTVELSVSKAPDDRLLFEVKDTGIGITAEDLARLFQPFVQVDLSTTRRFGGTGLGLAISKQLAELMGGLVGARSAVGAGSTFWFSVKAPPQASPVAIEAPAVVMAATPRPLRILLAEDNAVNQQITVKMLGHLGYRADLVENGLDALAALAKTPYDVVLMDVHMPEMDGLEATRQVRGWARPQPWIIAITASAMPDDQVKCFGAGVNDFLAKPVKVEALDQALRHAPLLPTR